MSFAFPFILVLILVLVMYLVYKQYKTDEKREYIILFFYKL